MAMRQIVATDPASMGEHILRVKGFKEGTVSGAKPTVVLAVLSIGGSVLGTFEFTPTEAQTLGEYLRQEAEYASKNEEE